MTDENTQASVTTWINSLKEGREEAATELWNRYFTRLISVTQARLRGANRRVSDEEDIVATTFNDVFRQAREGRFPSLYDRQDLWQILLTISERKVINKRRDDNRLKRGAGQVRGDSLFGRAEDASPGFEQLPNTDPTPEFCLTMKEACSDLLEMLDKPHRQLALLKLRNFTNPEIAAHLGCSLATVERRLRRIREIWGRQDEG